MKCDFSGWATKNDLKCADGRIIKHGAFRASNGQRVPLIWNHQHASVGNVLGHAILEERPEGIYAYCSFNNTTAGKDAKETVVHGDVVSLSIWANNVEQIGNEVIHGNIREVSLVLAGANPGAYIESAFTHGEPMEDGAEEGVFYTGENIIISHADSEDDEETKKKEEPKKEEKNDDGETVQEVLNTLNDKQKAAVGILVSQIQKGVEEPKKEEPKKEEKKEDEEVKHNLFEGKAVRGGIISHSDMEKILADAKRLGSLRDAVDSNIENGVLSHSLDTTGMETATGKQTYGFNDPDMLFPDYKSTSATPEWISRNMEWVTKLMSKVRRTPFSRIKSLYADITEDEARAKGYIKGKQKKEEVFSTLKRTTSPQTIYKKQKLDRDDIIDIVDFNVVAWIKAEMRVMLDEEIARAILIGDGRAADAEDKIKEDCIRPVVKDVPLFNTIIKVSVAHDADEATVAKETIKAIIRGRKNYKGSGRPDFWTTEDSVTEMLLLEDTIGHAIYKSEAELATKLRVAEIIPVEPMENQVVKITSGETTTSYPLIGVVVNMTDYTVGADKGGAIAMFEDFDIDYNQQKYLIETRISGALTRPFSALTIVLDRSANPAG